LHKASRPCARKLAWQGNVDPARRVWNRCRIRKDKCFVIDMWSREEVWRIDRQDGTRRRWTVEN
jgi:hypothetical protein